jgi:hypothetical protein
MKIGEITTVDGSTEGLPVVDLANLQSFPRRERNGMCPVCFSFVDSERYRFFRDRKLPSHIAILLFCHRCHRPLLPALF